jgi:single-strand DNA-binding protein
MNKVFLIGNLTKDPELTTTNNGLSVCKFSIAVSRRFGQNETDFFNIVVWRGQADNCHKYLKMVVKLLFAALFKIVVTRVMELKSI